MCATLASWVCREVNGLLGSVATGVLVKELCAPNLKLDNVAPFSFRLCVANAGTINGVLEHFDSLARGTRTSGCISRGS